MSVRVNGVEDSVGAGETLQAYLVRRGVDPRAVAVEIDGRVLKRDEFASTVLAEGNCVEIVRFVGGG